MPHNSSYRIYRASLRIWTVLVFVVGLVIGLAVAAIVVR